MYVVRSFLAGRMVGRIGVSEPREARRQVARLISEPQDAPDRVTVWRNLEDRSLQVADFRLDIEEEFKYNDGILTISDEGRGE